MEGEEFTHIAIHFLFLLFSFYLLLDGKLVLIGLPTTIIFKVILEIWRKITWSHYLTS